MAATAAVMAASKVDIYIRLTLLPCRKYLLIVHVWIVKIIKNIILMLHFLGTV